jgi:hypothetical protein
VSYYCFYCGEEIVVGGFNYSRYSGLTVINVNCSNHKKSVSFIFVEEDDIEDMNFSTLEIYIGGNAHFVINTEDKIPELVILKFQQPSQRIMLDVSWLSLSPEQIIDKAKLLLKFI